MDLLNKLAIAIFSLLLGYIITRLLDRARPLLVIESFATATKATTKTVCPDNISELSKTSWVTGTIQPGETEWGKLGYIYSASVAEIDSLVDAEKHAEKIIDLINKAQTERDISDAIKEIFEHRGMQDILEMMFLRDLVSCEKKEYEEEPFLSGFLHSERDGCYIIVFDDAIGKIGKKLNIDEWRAKNLEPLFNAIRYHDKDLIINSLKLLNTYSKDQRDIHLKLKELLTPMRVDETIWIAHCSLSNYGKSPLIIQPKAELHIIRPDKKREEPIPCYVSVEEQKENSRDANDLIGPKVLPPNSEIKLWVITKDKKSKMNNGNLIEGYFKDQQSLAQITINIEQPHFSVFTKTKSTYLSFTEKES